MRIAPNGYGSARPRPTGGQGLRFQHLFCVVEQVAQTPPKGLWHQGWRSSRALVLDTLGKVGEMDNTHGDLPSLT